MFLRHETACVLVGTKSDLRDVVVAIHLAKTIFRRIQWNLFFSLLYNSAGIPAAAGIFFPYHLPPSFAGLAMALSSVSVLMSSLALKRYPVLRMICKCTFVLIVNFLGNFFYQLRVTRALHLTLTLPRLLLPSPVPAAVQGRSSFGLHLSSILLFSGSFLFRT